MDKTGGCFLAVKIRSARFDRYFFKLADVIS